MVPPPLSTQRPRLGFRHTAANTESLPVELLDHVIELTGEYDPVVNAACCARDAYK